MKTRILRPVLAIFILLSLLTSAATAAGDTVYSNSRLLADNLEYTNTVAWDETLGRTESFSIRMTGPGDAYPIVMKGDTIYGSQRISAMTGYAGSLGKNVLAVVNADFFSDFAIPLGIVIEDGVYKSSPNGRNAIVFGYDGSVGFVAGPSVRISLHNNGGSPDADNAGKTVNLSNFNKMRSDTGGMTLYSDVFSTISTRTTTPGWFVRFKVLEGTMTVSGTMLLEVAETLTSDGAIPIGEGYLVLSAADLSYIDAEYEKFAVGDIVTLTTVCTEERLRSAGYATGSGDDLVINGVKADTSGWSASLRQRAPRTAFGIRADGSVVCYIIDGRNAEHSVGMTPDELADEMLRQNCVYAVNLDGGGSTALSIRMPGDSAAGVVSRPSDGSERGCSTYILFVTDAEPDGRARNLSLKNNGVIVLAESQAELSLAATDRGYMPAETPDDIRITLLVPGASVSGTTYTAGGIAGTDWLELYSPSTGASGIGEVYVITRPTSITAVSKDSGAPIQSVRIAPGDTLEFDVVATYYRRAVVAQAHSFTYDVTGDIGEMTAPGVFTASLTSMQRGAITISAGGRSTEIRIEISGFVDMIGHWANDYADYLLQAGITKGITETEYGPSLLMKRADFILMLYRAAGLPENVDNENFDDVPPEMYYSDALAWAKASGIAHGAQDNLFYPQEPLTRQDAFTFTYRALGILGKQYTDGSAEELEPFPDADTVNEYAVVPTATLIRLGVVDGMDGILSPHSTMTRAQMAKVLAVVLQLP